MVADDGEKISSKNSTYSAAPIGANLNWNKCDNVFIIRYEKMIVQVNEERKKKTEKFRVALINFKLQLEK